MSRIASNFGRLEYDAHAAAVVADDDADRNVPDNIRGLRFDAKALILVSAIIGCWVPPLGMGGIGAGVLYLLASKPATTTTVKMDANIKRHDGLGGCFWLLVTCAIGLVAFVAGLAFLGVVAEAGRS